MNRQPVVVETLVEAVAVTRAANRGAVDADPARGRLARLTGAWRCSVWPGPFAREAQGPDDGI